MENKKPAPSILNKAFKILPEADPKFPIKIPSAQTRNPLADLPENCLKLRTVHKKSWEIQENNFSSEEGAGVVRSKSTNKVEEKLNYRYVTERLADDATDKIDEVFVRGDQHYINYVSTQNNCVVKKETTENKVIQKTGPTIPAKKRTLVRRFSDKRNSRFDTSDLYKDCMYDADYCNDNFKLMLMQENKYIFRISYLKKYINEEYRRVIINWLIYAQQALALAEPTFFVTIRMFDNLSVLVKIPTKTYALTGITCMWIASKLVNSGYVGIPKLFSLCCEKYSKAQFYDMERQILKALKFDLNYPDLPSFLFYYLKILELESHEKVRNAAMFLLECCTFLIEFSATAPSMLAAVALHLALEKFELNTALFLVIVKANLADEDIFKHFSNKINVSLKELLQRKQVCTEVVAKYSTAKAAFVAQFFQN